MQWTIRRGVMGAAALSLAVGGCQAIAPFFPESITRLFLDTGAGAVGMNLFSQIQIDPASEDSAGPHFVAAGFVDGDDYIDVVSAWNESKPLEIHFQRRDQDGEVTFDTITLAGDFPISIVSGLAIEDMDGDGQNDIVVLVKDTGVFARCRATGEDLDSEDSPAGVIVIFFSPVPQPNDGSDDDPNDELRFTNALRWEGVELSQSKTAGASPADATKPEEGGFTDMAIGDIDGVNGPDIVVAWNAAECEGGGNRVEYYANPGSGTARQPSAWAPQLVEFDVPAVKSVALADVDRDGDMDILMTYPTARGGNVRWRRNPLIDFPDPFHLSDGTWQRGVIGEVATGADIITTGDIDQDGITDVVVRSTAGLLLQWFKGPENPTTSPVRSISWQVFSIAEFTSRVPEAIVLGDIDGDGRLELVASAQGALLWFDPFESATPFDQWNEHLLIDDDASGGATPALTDPNVNPTEISEGSTFINGVVVIDLDGDGLTDIISTLDRRGGSGLTNDAIIWYRNNQLDGS